MRGRPPNRHKITKDAIDGAEPGTMWDTVVTGFGLRVSPKGRKTLFFKYGTGRRGRARSLIIGELGKPCAPDPRTGDGRMLTAALARSEAERLRGIVVAGGDPAGDLARRRKIPTFAEFSERYMLEHGAVHKAATTQKGDRWFLDHKIKPEFGSTRLDRVDRGWITKWHAAMKAQPHTANSALGLLSAIFSKAIEWSVGPTLNPCAGVKWFPTASRERLLSPEELRRIGAVLADPGADLSMSSRAAIYLLMFTGARREEIATLRWSQIDEAPEVVVAGVVGRVVRQKSKTTGAHGKRPILFAAHALAVVAKLDRVNEWLLPGRHGVGHIAPGSLSGAWKRAARRAGVEDAHLHDCRHLFISTAVRGGRSIPDAAKLAGQSTMAITEDYFHMAPGDLLELADATAAAISGNAGTLTVIKRLRPAPAPEGGE